MFSSGNTLYIMPTRYAGGKAITPFSNLTFEKLNTHDILLAKQKLENNGITAENAIIGGGDLWLLSPKERSEYINFICGEFANVCAEVLPSSIFASNHSNCHARYLLDFAPHATKSKELFTLKQIGNARTIAYLNTAALKYGFNNCIRIASSIEGVHEIYFADWIYKTHTAKNFAKADVARFKTDMKNSRIKTTLKIKNNEPIFGAEQSKTFYLFPNGYLTKLQNDEIVKV